MEYEQVFWGYNAMLAHPLMYLGMEDAAIQNIDWLIANPSCPRGWMEAMPSKVDEQGLRKIGPGIIGDVPHGWVAGYMVLFIRNMLIREENNQLYLFSCVPEQWFEPDQEITIADAPTYFGTIGFSVKSHEKDIEITFTHEQNLSADYLIFSPLKKPLNSVKIDGQVTSTAGRTVTVPAAARSVILYY